MGLRRVRDHVSPRTSKGTPAGLGNKVDNQVYAFLKERAKGGKTVEYSEVASLLGIDLGDPGGRVHLSKELGEISEYEHAHDRPMLSAIVVEKGSQEPARGFWSEARKLGKLHSHDEADEVEFWVKEREKVFAYWKHHG